MKRMILLTSMVAIICSMMPVSASATDYDPDSDGYTYIYVVFTDPRIGPVIRFYDFIPVQYTTSEWADVLKGYSHQTVGNTDIYVLPDQNMSGIIYYNPDGKSTTILLLPGNLISFTSEQL